MGDRLAHCEGRLVQVQSAFEQHLEQISCGAGSFPAGLQGGRQSLIVMRLQLIDAGVHMGFPRRIAEEIVLQTVSGSVEFARQSGKHMAELRNMVTSPGGTSAEAIYQMEKGGLRTVFSKSVYAAFQRTQTLAAAQEKE